MRATSRCAPFLTCYILLDTYSVPNDEFPNNGMEDPEGGPNPENTSGYGLSTADLLDQISTEPTRDPDTLELSTEVSTQTTQASDSLSTLNPTIREAPTERTGT